MCCSSESEAGQVMRMLRGLRRLQGCDTAAGSQAALDSELSRVGSVRMSQCCLSIPLGVAAVQQYFYA